MRGPLIEDIQYLLSYYIEASVTNGCSIENSIVFFSIVSVSIVFCYNKKPEPALSHEKHGNFLSLIHE